MREKIKEIMKSVFEMDNVDDSISQFSCDKWDSLHFLSLVVSLEENFNVEFEPEDLEEMNSLDNIELKINKLIK